MTGRVLISLPMRSLNLALHAFSTGLEAAFQRLGWETVCIDLAECKGLPGLIQKVRYWQPDFTLAFNGILPDANIGTWTDFTGRPHVCLLVDQPYAHWDITEDQGTHIACVTKEGVRLLKACGFERSFFLPHACDPDILDLAPLARRYEAVMIATFMDPKVIIQRWDQSYSKALVQSMQDSAHGLLEDSSLSTLELLQEKHKIAFIDFSQASFEGVSLRRMALEVDLYLRALDRIELARVLAPIGLTIFGGSHGGAGWESVGLEGVQLHPPVSYSQSLQIQRQARIVANSAPHLRRGSHERLFSVPACRAQLVTSGSSYLSSGLGASSSIVVYNRAVASDLLDRVHTLPVKPDEALRERIQQQHTWDVRAQVILAQLQA